MEQDTNPYDLGWGQGYDDQLPDCPFTEGTEEYDEFWRGYDQGSMDC